MLARSCSSFHCSSGGRQWSQARQRDSLSTLSPMLMPESWSQKRCGRGERSSMVPEEEITGCHGDKIWTSVYGESWKSEYFSYWKCSDHKSNGIHPGSDVLSGDQRLTKRWKEKMILGIIKIFCIHYRTLLIPKRCHLSLMRPINFTVIAHGLLTAPFQHNIKQSVSHIFSWHGQSHQLHTGDVQGVGRRVGELVEPPVTVGKRTRWLSRHGWGKS